MRDAARGVHGRRCCRASGRPVRSLRCQYTLTPDRDFVLGAGARPPVGRRRARRGARLQVRADVRPDPGRPGDDGGRRPPTSRRSASTGPASPTRRTRRTGWSEAPRVVGWRRCGRTGRLVAAMSPADPEPAGNVRLRRPRHPRDHRDHEPGAADRRAAALLRCGRERRERRDAERRLGVRAAGLHRGRDVHRAHHEPAVLTRGAGPDPDPAGALPRGRLRRPDRRRPPDPRPASPGTIDRVEATPPAEPDQLHRPPASALVGHRWRSA